MTKVHGTVVHILFLFSPWHRGKEVNYWFTTHAERFVRMPSFSWRTGCTMQLFLEIAPISKPDIFKSCRLLEGFLKETIIF